MRWISIFIVETELQTRGALSILRSDKLESMFFTSNVKIFNYLKAEDVSVYLLDKEHRGGIFGKLIFYIKYVSSIESKIPKKCAVKLYFPRLDSLYDNLVYTRLSALLGTHFRSALLPDGVMSYYIGELSKRELKRIRRYRRILNVVSLGKYSMTEYLGNSFGTDLVDYVYHFGKKTPINGDKCVSVEFQSGTTIQGLGGKVVLIVGQNLQSLNKELPQVINSIQKNISDLVGSISPKKIFYARHPRSCTNEFDVSKSVPVGMDYLCVEDIIAELGISHVISCSSSVLFNAKIIMGDKVDCYSVGLNIANHLSADENEAIRSLYQSVGVKEVSCLCL